MKAIHYSFLVTVFAFLVACGGGGGGTPSTAQPTTPPIDTTNYPNWVVSNASSARATAQGQVWNFTSAQIGSLLVRHFGATNRWIQGDTIGTGPRRFPTICSGTTCTTDFRSVGGSVSSATIAAFGSSAILNAAVYQPIMTKNSINIGQVRSRLENAPSTGQHRNYLGFFGFLDYSAFAVSGTGIYRGSQLSTLYADADSFGNSPGTNPTSSSGSATWSGVMLGIDYSSGTSDQLNALQGDTSITVRGFASTPTVDVSFSNVRNLNTGARHNFSGWSAIPLSNGIFRTGSGTNQIEGTFYGSEHQEVGGHFEQGTIIGAFGGKRQ